MTPNTPYVSPELVEHLAKMWPDICADPDKINPHRALGRADVIRHLRAVVRFQEENMNVRT
jgi:hypothetical protein